MQQTKVNKQSGQQAPPLAVLGGWSKIGAPDQLHAAGVLPEARPKHQHKDEHQQVNEQQGAGHGHTRWAAAH